MDTHCDACGAENIDGQHPNVTCSEKEWAIHQARLLGQIAYLLKRLVAALPSAQNSVTVEAKPKASE